MRKFLATLLVLIFIPIFVFVFIVYNTQSFLLDENELKDSLAKVNFYEKITPALISDLSKTGTKSKLISDKEFKDLLNNSVPADSIRSETEKTIDAIIPYLKSETDGINLEYDLKEYKESFVAETNKLLLNKVKSLPTCTNKQLDSLDLNNLENIPVKCKPAGLSATQIIKEIGGADLTREINALLPNKLVLTEKEFKSIPTTSEFGQDDSSITLLSDARDALSIIGRVLNFGIIALLVILVLIILLRWGSIRSMAKWVGWTLLISSILSAVVAVGIFALPSFLESVAGELGESAVVAASVASNLSEKLFTARFVPQTIVIVIVSLALIIIPSLIKTKDRSEVTT